jgi:hypothetical protein
MPAQAQKKATEIKTEKKDPGVYHIRLKQAAIFKDGLSGLDLNALQERSSGTISRDLPEERLLRVKQAVALGRIEPYDPNMPEMTELPPPPKKDLTKTSEYKVLAHPDEEEILKYIDMAITKKQSGILSLKIMHHLETAGENPGLAPRESIVNALETGLKSLGIDRPNLSTVEVDRILTINTEPQEILSSVQ